MTYREHALIASEFLTEGDRAFGSLTDIRADVQTLRRFMSFLTKSDRSTQSITAIRAYSQTLREVQEQTGAHGTNMQTSWKSRDNPELAVQRFRQSPGDAFGGAGVFLVLAAKAPASVWKVHRSARGLITNIEKKQEYVYHYSFHIIDPAFGHLAITMSGHPPFGAQVMLNGHEYVAVAAQADGIGFTKKGNCFTVLRSRIRRAWPRSQMPGRVMRL